MGLNSGEVVVGTIGDDLKMVYTAHGNTVGLGQRMEQLAEPGRVYLTDHTGRLVPGFFRLRDVGSFELKGVSEPVRVYDLEVTVLFADLKGSMDLSESIDPEDWHRVMERSRILTDGVHRLEGTVNQYTGDGIMALLTGDEPARDQKLRKAQRLFLEIGAPTHAERVAKELEL